PDCSDAVTVVVRSPLTLSLSSSLFSHRCGAHRDLHSFPTRRSSDLAADAGKALHFSKNKHCFHTLRFLSRAPYIEIWRVWKQCLDRKSTRLNSSHVSISYAVFCLKKKNETVLLHWV